MRMNLLTRLTCISGVYFSKENFDILETCNSGAYFSKENFDILLTCTCGAFSMIRNFDKRATFTDTIPPATIAVADTDPSNSAIILAPQSACKRHPLLGLARLNQTDLRYSVLCQEIGW